MGKRKLHECTYFQCDWTGLPMRTSLCYMPVFRENADKMLKQGSYVCWEAVVAHASEKCANGDMTEEDLKLVKEHINNLVGCEVGPAPHWTELHWLSKADLNPIDAETFFLKCEMADNTDKTAVILHSNGDAGEITASRAEQHENFASFLGAGDDWEVQSFVSTRKKVRDREVVVFHINNINNAFNEKASNIFKMKLYGDVVIAQKTKETCYWTRTRYVDYTLAKFNDKRKHPDTAAAMTVSDFKKAKVQMEDELSSFEGCVSSLSSRPEDLARASVIVPPDAQDLAALKDPDGKCRQALKMARLEARFSSQPLQVAA